MSAIQKGQCGLCSHYGEGQSSSAKLVSIRSSHEASESLIETCGHPKHADLHLKVTPISGCDGFSAAA